MKHQARETFSTRGSEAMQIIRQCAERETRHGATIPEGKRRHRRPSALTLAPQFSGAVLLNLLSALFAGIMGCAPGEAPEFGTGGGGGTEEELPPPPSSVQFELVSHENNQKVPLDESNTSILEVIVRATTESDPSVLDNLRVVWCDTWRLQGEDNRRQLCSSGDQCDLASLQGQDLAREAKLVVTGVDLNTYGEPELEHTIRARLVPKSFNPPGGDFCTAAGGTERTVRVSVRQLVSGPATTILAAPDGGCHTRKYSLRARINSVSEFNNASYRVRWYKDSPEGSSLLKDNVVNAVQGVVCSGDDVDAGSICVLEPARFQKGDVIWVTASVVATASGTPVAGAETQNPAQVDICDAWPECQQFTIAMEPPGVGGVLRCSAMCNDPDGDPISAEAEFVNQTQGGKTKSAVTQEPMPLSVAGPVKVEVTMSLPEEAPTFAVKADTLLCHLFPFGPDQSGWRNDPEYPYTSNQNEAKEGSHRIYNASGTLGVKNTPPAIGVVKVLPSLAPKDVGQTFTCDIAGQVSDVDLQDSKHRVEYQWVNGSLGNAPIGALRKGLYNIGAIPTTNVNDSALVPVQEGGITKGQDLCCEVRVMEEGEVYTLTTQPAPARACVTLDNGAPTLIPPPATPGQPAPTLNVGIKLAPGTPEALECTPDDAPILGNGVYYTWQPLVCEHNGQLSDPDPDDHGSLFFEYRWHLCNGGIYGAEVYKSGQNIAPPMSLPKGAFICCAVLPCDSKGCNLAGALQMSPSNAVQVANSPPAAKTPEVLPTDPGAEGDKLDFFTCNANPLDCDADDENSLLINYEWFKVSQTGAATKIGPAFGTKSQKFAASELACSDSIACSYLVSDGTPAIASALSAPRPLANKPPQLSQIQTTAMGIVTPTSTVTCKWSGVADPNQDPVSKIEVMWRTGDGQTLFQIPQTVTGVGNVPNGEVQLKLGTCGGASLVQPDTTLSCEVRLCDPCTCSPWISSAQAPFGSVLSIVDNPTPITLKPGAKLASINVPKIDKQVPFQCTLNTQSVELCDPSDLASFTFVHQLVGPGNVVLANAEAAATSMLQSTFNLATCPNVKTAWCRITVLSAQGQQLLVGTSDTVDIDENPPTVSADLVPNTVVVGDTVTCVPTALDPDPEDQSKLIPLIRWYRNGVELPQFQGESTLLLSEGVFKASDAVRCSAQVSDGCFPAVVAQSPTVVLGNTPPTVASPTVTPQFPKAGNTLTCTVDINTYNDPDGDALALIQFQWQTAPTTAGPWTTVNPLATCQKEFQATAQSTLTLAGCAPAIGKNNFVRCLATPLDKESELTGAPGKTATSAPVLVQDSLPYFTGPVVVQPATGLLPSAPTLDAGQDNVVCVATAKDDDPGDTPTIAYTWAVLDSAGNVKKELLPSPVSNVDVRLAFPEAAPCDTVRCTARLSSGGMLVETQVATIGIRNGGSLRFPGTPAVVDITSQAPAGVTPPSPAPASGLLELWWFAESLPAPGSRHMLAYGEGSGGTPQWELYILPTGAVQVRRQGALPSIAPEASWPVLTPNVWSYIAIRWESTATSLQVGGSAANSVAFNDGLPFNLVDTVLGSITEAPRGWLDELRVSNAALTPNAGDVYFQTTPNTLAAYHFELDKTVVPIDSGPWQFHGVLGAQKPSQSYHAQLSTCGQEACVGEGPCVTQPSSVNLVFAGTPIAPGAGASQYQVLCNASGAIDLQAGPVSQYQFTWKNASNGATLAGSPINASGSATLTVPVAQGCITVICEAAPYPVGGTTPGIPGVSQPATLCKATTATLVNFGCDDGNPCSQDAANVATGCQHDFNGSGICTANCAPGQVAQCSPGPGFPCSCGDPCPDDPATPCVESVFENGSCVPKAKANGASCVPFDLCAAPSALGTCNASVCAGYTLVSCNDNNPCTTDQCLPQQGCVYTNNNSPCSDNNACTNPDVCSGGNCLSGGAVTCNDGNACTSDACNPAAAVPGQSACVFTPLNGPACDDGNPCSIVDSCQNGVCTGEGAAACDDGNPCTADACAPLGGCQNTPHPMGFPCSDGDACTVGDLCSGGVCVPGAPASCDDGNVCTTDSCDPLFGCQNIGNSLPCPDGNACTSNETCNAATKACVSQPVACNDNNPCTNDSCNPATGCVFVNNSAACNDGSLCTTSDICIGGTCTGGPPLACNDSNPCTDDSCNPATGCVYTNNAAQCSDNNACTQNDSCVGGSCQSGPVLNCNAGNNNPCVQSICSPATGCGPLNPVAGGCSDGNQCTAGDTCQSGICAGNPINCNDGNPCTDDSCDPLSGCKYVGNNNACNDGNECTINDVCNPSTFICQGTGANCDDNNPCTTDTCTVQGGCQHTANTNACNDNNACTTNDVCSGGLCVGGPAPNCNDNESCTDDGCAPIGGCFNVSNNQNTCTDGNACTTGDACLGGTCITTGTLVCNDNNPCTNDSCAPATGCVFTPNTVPCNDGNACTTNDTCAGGACVGGPALVCNDNNPCTSDTCAAATGCVYTNNTLPCSDGNACTTNDTCAAGTCVGGPAPNCNDLNTCTTDLCNVASGCVYVANTAPCDDNNACTTNDNCANSFCVGGPALTCNDNNPCTTDSCNPSSGCVFTNNTSPCNDNNACTTNDTCAGGQCVGGPAPTCNDNNPCTDDACVAPGGCVFTPNTAPCSDGNACTEGDVCSSGNCVPGPGLQCNDNNPCTNNTCTQQNGCAYPPNDVACDDGNACTTNDLCSFGSCQPGAALTCNDGNACTADSCNPATGCVHAPLTGTACSDGNACTSGDACQNGVCTSTGSVNCDDGNACITNTCNPATGCVNTFNTLACDDGDACTAGDTCSGGICVSGNPLNCNDNNPCTADSCNPASGCVNTLAAVGAPCDDNDPCTLDDACDAQGVCGGDLTWCCAQPSNFPSLCNFTETYSLAPASTETYGGPTCAEQTLTGGQNLTCFGAPPSAFEVCLDVQGGAAGKYMLFEDLSSAFEPDQCAAQLSSGVCTPVAAGPQGMTFWQAALHAAAGSPDARMHVRCPPNATSCGGTPILTCNNPLACNTAGWQSNINNYSACMSGQNNAERTFRFDSQKNGAHTIWLSSNQDLANLTIFVSPVPSTATTCGPSEANNCFAHGQSPLTFNADVGQRYCIFVERTVAPAGTPTLNMSVSCY